MNDITTLLNRMEKREPEAANELMSIVYNELRRLAAHKMAHEMPGHTLQATALVHEAWLRLGGDDQSGWQNRGHFFAAAAEAMRRILVERARRRSTIKHGGGFARVEFEGLDVPALAPSDDKLLQVNEALEKLAVVDPRKALLVKLRYFTGLSFQEAAQALGIAVPTAKEWWSYARAWLSVEIGGTPES